MMNSEFKCVGGAPLVTPLAAGAVGGAARPEDGAAWSCGGVPRAAEGGAWVVAGEIGDGGRGKNTAVGLVTGTP